MKKSRESFKNLAKGTPTWGDFYDSVLFFTDTDDTATTSNSGIVKLATDAQSKAR